MELGRVSVAVIGAVLLLCLNCGSHADQTSYVPPELWTTHEVTFRMYIGGQFAGDIVFAIFYNICPKTVENFLAFVNGNATDPDGKALPPYKGNIWHRVIKGFMGQGGDVISQNGWGVVSIYGTYFPDENFAIHHNGAGWLGMANAGKDTNACQYYVTFVQTTWLDDGHTIFGKVIKGMSTLRQIENNPTYSNDRPIKEVVVEDCWVTVVDQPYTVPWAPSDESV